MRILIVDDEAPARERLRRLLAELDGDYEIAGEAADGLDALDICGKLEIDLVLLDIYMPGMDGLEAAARLAEREPPPAVVLVTAYPEHALEAFKHRVEDYLVKPVRRERLQDALERARVPTRPQRAAMMDRAQAPPRRSRLTARYRGGVQTVPVEAVIYLQAEKKYVTLRFGDGHLLLDESLKSLEEEFPELFVRIHRNALVARSSIAGLEKDADGSTLIRLRGCDERLPVSRRHLAGLRRWLRSGRTS
jgi:two-component system response regulator AlgR